MSYLVNYSSPTGLWRPKGYLTVFHAKSMPNPIFQCSKTHCDLKDWTIRTQKVPKEALSSKSFKLYIFFKVNCRPSHISSLHIWILYFAASWMYSQNESKPGTICITAVYNFCTRHQSPLLPGTLFSPGRQVQGTIVFPGSEMPGTIFSLAVKFLKEQKKNLTVQNSCVEYKDKLDPARRVQRGHWPKNKSVG